MFDELLRRLSGEPEPEPARAPVPNVDPYPLKSPYDWDELWLEMFEPVNKGVVAIFLSQEKSTAVAVLQSIDRLSAHPFTNPEYVAFWKRKIASMLLPQNLPVKPLRNYIDAEWYGRFVEFVKSMDTVQKVSPKELRGAVDEFHKVAARLLRHSSTNPAFVQSYLDDVDTQFAQIQEERRARRAQREYEQSRLEEQQRLQAQKDEAAKLAEKARQQKLMETAKRDKYKLLGAMPRFAVVSAEERMQFLTGDTCPLSSVVGNEKAVELMRWILADGLGNPIHRCDHNLAFLGPSSAGKTTLSRLFSKALEVPHVEISPKSVKSPQDIFDEIHRACKEANLPFINPSKLNGDYIAPPMVVLLDEAHALSNSVQQVLLKATERNDARLTTESGYSLNCQTICWHLATTDLGKMFDALMTRFKPVRLRLYTKTEIAEIVRRKYPEWTEETCLEIAKYCSRVPREALHFAEMVSLAQCYSTGDAVAKVAELNGIDPFGMTYQRLAILKALGRKPMSIAELCATLQVKEEELRNYILPWLLESTPDQEPYVVVTNRHYITEVGLKELDKRGLAHRGTKVLPKA